MLNQSKEENKIASFCTQKIWKKKFEKKFYLLLENYNGDKRDNFFRETIKILNTNFNKFFFLSGGSLLGFIRESNFIKWDDNIDLSFYYDANSLDDLKKLQNIFLEKDYIARIYCKKNYVKVSLYKFGYKLDLTTIYESKEFYFSNTYKFPKSCLGEFKKVSFKGINVNIPLNTESYLNYLYGDWRLPKKNNYATIQSSNKFRYTISLVINKFLSLIKK